jgi:hypothetical protein
VPDEVRKGFPEVGEELKASFSKNAPGEIEYIVIVSDIEKVSCEVHQNEKMLGVPVRGYVATSRRVNRTEWEDSIRGCSTELEHLTWTKISGGIRCWDQFIYDRDHRGYQGTRQVGKKEVKKTALRRGPMAGLGRLGRFKTRPVRPARLGRSRRSRLLRNTNIINSTQFVNSQTTHLHNMYVHDTFFISIKIFHP